jgi:anti-sigma factor RsiW
LNCQEAQKLIHGYADGELELTKNLEIDQHLQECPACAEGYAGLQGVRTAIKENAHYYTTPPDLQNRIQASVRRASQSRAPVSLRPWPWFAVAAAAACLLIGGWGLFRWLVRADEPFLVRELLASHIRSQMLPGHQIDIPSSNQHVVKPWFDGKLDFSPAVKDFTEQGFPLIGGRLDYLDNRPVAVLVYKRREHIINLFVWPSVTSSEAATGALTRQGYHLVHWAQSGMSYWAVSNLNESELQDFLHLVQQNAP